MFTRRVNRWLCGNGSYIAYIVAWVCALALFAPLNAYSAEPIITLAGAGPQGRWFKEVSLFASVLDANMKDVEVNGVIGKGVSIGNIKRTAVGQIQGGRAFFLDLIDAYDNKGAFTDSRNYKNVVAWMALNPLMFRLIAGKNIKSYADLKGRKVAIGARGSGDDSRAKEILASYGVTEKNSTFLYLGREEAQRALANHQIDALLLSYSRNNRGHLGPLFAARPLRTDLHFVDPNPAITKKFLANHKGFFLDTKGEPVFGRPHLNGLGVWTGLVINQKTVPASLVYKMTKVLFDHWSEILQSAPWLSKEELSVAPQFDGAPYDAGAIRFFKQKGVWKEFHGD